MRIQLIVRTEDSDIYIYRYRPGQEADLIRRIRSHVDDPSLGLTEDHAIYLMGILAQITAKAILAKAPGSSLETIRKMIEEGVEEGDPEWIELKKQFEDLGF